MNLTQLQTCQPLATGGTDFDGAQAFRMSMTKEASEEQASVLLAAEGAPQYRAQHIDENRW